MISILFTVSLKTIIGLSLIIIAGLILCLKLIKDDIIK